MQDYKPKPDHLRDRVILISGAGAGIGRTLAVRCAAQGATVILLGRTVRKLEQVYDEIDKAGYPQAAIYPMNLEGAAPKDYDDLAQVLQREFGRLDGLVNNAALLPGLTPIANYTVEAWYQTLQVNLNAPFLLTQALLTLLRQSADASVIFSTDGAGVQGRPYWGAYAVAKSGLDGLMKILAAELESNTAIRVNAVDPGPVGTTLRLKVYPAADRTEWAAPDDVIDTFLYLLGADSRAVTGKTFQAQV